MTARATPPTGAFRADGRDLFMFGLLYVVLIGFLIAIGIGWFFAVLIAAGGLFAQWYFSDRMASSR